MPPEADRMCTPRCRVLLATDLTDLRQTLPVAIKHALRYNAELKLVHVLPDVTATEMDPRLFVHKDRDEAAAILEDAVKAVIQAGVKCSLTIRTGQAAGTVGQIVQEWNPDCVVVGSHSTRKFRQKLLGSVAEAIFREIEAPVLTVGPRVLPTVLPKILDDGRPSAKRHHALIATALDRESRSITESVLDFAWMHQTDLTMLHVIPDIAKAHPSSLRVRAYAERMFHEILSTIGAERPHPSCMIERGPVVETILRVAAQGHFDLVLLGAVSGSSFRREIMPGTAYGVICGAPCPVLVLKQALHRSITRLSVAS